MICPDERRDERACPGLSDAFAERHPRPNHGASSHSLRRASPLRSGSAVRSTAVSFPRHNESHSGDSSSRPPQAQAARRGNEPGIPLSSTILSHGGVARKRDSGQTRGNDSASHGYSHPRDGWVVVDRHKDTTTRGPLLTFTPVRGRLSPHTVIRHGDAGRLRGGNNCIPTTTLRRY